MNNKKSLLQDSLQELENIKNESLELAKEQLINESADLLEKKSAELFEKLISEGAEEGTDEKESEKSHEEKEKEDSEEELETEPSEKEDDEEECDDEEEEGDDEEEDDINFDDKEEDDDEEFMSVKVDEKVIAESNLRNKNNMKNNRKEALKDLRDVSFNKLVEAYYNMDEMDSFVVQDEDMDESYEEDEYEIEDDPEFERRMSGKKFKPSSRELQSMRPEKEVEYDPYADVRKGSEYSDEEEMDEELMYEVDMEEGMYEAELTDEDINEMLAEMDMEDEAVMNKAVRASGMDKLQERQWTDKGMRSPAEKVELQQRSSGLGDAHIHDYMDEDMFDEDVPSSEQGSAYNTQEKNRHFTSELEEAFGEMTMEELEEMHKMLEDDGSDADSMQFKGKAKDAMKVEVNPEEDFMSEEQEIEEMLASMQGEEELEESSAISSQTKMNRGNRGGGSVQGRPERRSGMISEDEMEEVQSLQEKIKKLEKEKETLQEGFVNKVKSLENKVYDVTISALKAGFVNKFLLEHPLRENEKTEIVYRFANAQTKEQIKETYISLTNEFAKGQTVKDGSMLNESVQSRVSKVHRTDNAIVREKNLISENDESNRFKQLLNYNFGRK